MLDLTCEEAYNKRIIRISVVLGDKDVTTGQLFS